MTRSAPICVLTGVLLLGACGGAHSGAPGPPGNLPPAGPGVVQVNAVGGSYVYAPDSIAIGVGDRVTWTNPTDVAHTVSFTDTFQPPHRNGTFDEALPVGGTTTRTFTAAGTYLYFCTVHPTMNAQIVVTPK